MVEEDGVAYSVKGGAEVKKEEYGEETRVRCKEEIPAQCPRRQVNHRNHISEHYGFHSCITGACDAYSLE